MTLIQNNSKQLVFNTKLDNINKVEKIVERVCSQLNINDDYYGNMLIAVTEAINNAILHGNSNCNDKNVELSCETIDNIVSFTIKDNGNGFDYSKIPDPTIPGNIHKINGRGVFLMKNLADKVVFDDNGSKVKLMFNISYN